MQEELAKEFNNNHQDIRSNSLIVPYEEAGEHGQSPAGTAQVGWADG